MNRISRNLSLLWRTESLIVQRRATAVRKQMGLLAVAGLVAIFGLAMLGIAAFFALKPFVGEASAALIVGVADLLIAALLALLAANTNADDELAPAIEVRDMTIKDLEAEAESFIADVKTATNDLKRAAHDPLGSLAPALAEPLIGAAIRGLRRRKNQPKSESSEPSE